MDSLAGLKAAHVAAAFVVLICGGLLAWRRGTVLRPWAWLWLPLVLAGLSLPFSGWWLVHRVGWSMGQLWLLASGPLYLLGAWALMLLIWRLGRPAGWRSRLAAVYAALFVVPFLAVMVLMFAKPV